MILLVLSMLVGIMAWLVCVSILDRDESLGISLKRVISLSLLVAYAFVVPVVLHDRFFG